MKCRSRLRLLLVAVTVAASGCASAHSVATGPATLSTTKPAPKAPATSPASTAPSVTATPYAVRRQQADAAVQAIVARQPDGGVSVAALNLASGRAYSAGATEGMWTASAYKLLVLVTLLMDDGGSQGLSDGDIDQATTMIENSDNVAAYSLFLQVGGRSGLADAISKLGMTHTVPGVSDPTFTTTSGSDYLLLLKALTGSGPLDAASRAFALGLMRNVEADQRWGVGAIADKGSDFANKNGWLSVDNDNGNGEDDDGLWAVSSAGIVPINGQQVLVAIFTRHQPSFDTGVALVEQLAEALKPAVS